MSESLIYTGGYSKFGSSTLTKVEDIVTKHFLDFPSRYAFSVEAEEVINHILMIQSVQSEKKTSVSCLNHNADNNSVIITIACFDRPKVYNAIASALDQVAGNIIEADIMTSSSGIVSNLFLLL